MTPQQIVRNVEILSAVPAGAPVEPPSELRLFAAGENQTVKGVFRFTPKSAKSVMAQAADYGNDRNFDYGHAMLGLQVDPAEAGKAAGWYKLEVRESEAGPELWAVDIRWTPKARAKILDLEFRYISPAFYTDKDGEISELINCALTNLPATKRMKPLMAGQTAEELSMDPILLAAFGLPATADATALSAAVAAHVKALCAVTGKDTLEQASAVVQAWKVGSERAEELAKQVAEIEAARKAQELEALIKSGQAAGKIAPAMLEWAKGQSVEALTAFLAVAPALVTPPAAPPAPAPKAEAKPGDDVQLTEAEIKMCSVTGTDPAKMLARKRERMAKGA